MSILSWAGVKRPFERGSAAAVFDRHIKRERARRAAADDDFNQDRFDRAAGLARRQLQKTGRAER